MSGSLILIQDVVGSSRPGKALICSLLGRFVTLLLQQWPFTVLLLLMMGSIFSNHQPPQCYYSDMHLN